jgi:hypothetical protein
MEAFLTTSKSRLQHRLQVVLARATAAVIVVVGLTLVAAIFSAITFYSLHTEQGNHTAGSLDLGEQEVCQLVSHSFGLYVPREHIILTNCSSTETYKICYVNNVQNCIHLAYDGPINVYRELNGLLLALQRLHHP